MEVVVQDCNSLRYPDTYQKPYGQYREMATTVSTQIKEVSSLALELLRYAQRAELITAMEKYGWMRWIIPIGILLIFGLLLLMFLPGMLHLPAPI